MSSKYFIYILKSLNPNCCNCNLLKQVSSTKSVPSFKFPQLMTKNGWDLGFLSQFETTAFFKSWISQQLGSNSHGAITATRTLWQIVADIQMSRSSWAWSVNMVMISPWSSPWWAEHPWDQHQALQRCKIILCNDSVIWQARSKGNATQLIPSL